MKFNLKFVVIGLALLLAVVLPSQAGILLGSLSTITTATTNSPTFQTNTVQIPLPTIYVSNGNLTSTNSYTGSFRWSFDNVTFYTNSSPQFNPASTNAGTTTIGAQTASVTIYIQMQAQTNAAPSNTGTITIGATTP